MPSGFFALLDDIAVLMDDVVVMGKIATKKTAGILGDDLAVNAEKASGFVSSREIPVLWAITKGSLLNKIIILPVAFLLSAFLPWIIVPILVVGGLYLAYEGAEKIVHFFMHLKDKDQEHTEKEIEDIIELSEEEILSLEKKKVKSAILTDFILSIEIVIIALGTVVGAPIGKQIAVVSFVALIATIGVYGIVALIVRMDDIGLAMVKRSKGKKGILKGVGSVLVNALPWIIKSLSVIGTIVLLLVSGGIFVHNSHFLHDLVHGIPSIVSEFFIGLIVGIIAMVFIGAGKKIIKKV